MPRNTSLYWWIDTFSHSTRPGYRWFLCGHFEDVKYPDWPSNGERFYWIVPNLVGVGGGQYAFRLIEVQP